MATLTGFETTVNEIFTTDYDHSKKVSFISSKSTYNEVKTLAILLTEVVCRRGKQPNLSRFVTDDSHE